MSEGQTQSTSASNHFDISGLVFPLVAARVNMAGGPLQIDRFIGSGFWVSSRGEFLTCRHVFESLEEGQNPAIGNPFASDQGSYIPVLGHRIHRKYDFGLGITPARNTRFLSPSDNARLLPGQAVSAFGFMDWGKDEAAKSLGLDVRYLRGHITRTSTQEQGPESPQVVEVSFGSPSGFSGTPLLSDQRVVGMLYGNVETKLQTYSLLEVKDGHNEYRETAYRVYEYGLAHHLEDLMTFLRECGVSPFT